MVTPSTTPLHDLIEWEFTLDEQGKVSRYGTYKGDYYKQYLPNGLAFISLFPPKKISKQLYDLAERRRK